MESLKFPNKFLKTGFHKILILKNKYMEKNSSSFCCDIDVATRKYSSTIFLIILLYNKDYFDGFG